MSTLHERLPSLRGFFACSPSPALATYVQRFWWLEGDLASAVDEQMLHPDGGSGLIFNFADPLLFNGNPQRPQALVVGPQLSSMRLQLPGQVRLMGVRFRPGMGAVFLGVGLHELTGINGAEEPKPAIAGLVEQLADLPRSAQQALVERHLMACLSDHVQRHAPVQQLLTQIAATEGRTLLTDLLKTVPLGQRQLERLFRYQVGLTPKQFSRIQRIARVRHELRAGDPLLDIALACGYSDQAHFIHDFRAVVGMTPGQYRQRALASTR